MAGAPHSTNERSPRPIEPRPTTLPWNLTWDDLRSGLPSIAEPVGVAETYQVQGLHDRGRSRILTLRYRDNCGRQRSWTLFFKLTDPKSREAQKYRYLIGQAAPVAPLVAFLDSRRGQVLVLDFLPTIGTAPQQADQLLDLIAHINAIRQVPSELFQPAAGDPNYDGEVLRALDKLVSMMAPQSAFEPLSLLEAYREATRRVVNLPLSLNHNELGFQHVGWTTGPDKPRLVLFDLQTMALLPNYTDIAEILAPLSHQTGRAEEDLFNTYLESLASHGGLIDNRAGSWRSMMLTRIVRTFEGLPWLLTMIEHADVENPLSGWERLRKDLTSLCLI